MEESSRKERVLGFYPGNLRKRAKVQNPQSIHLDRVLNQLVHLKLLGHHDHLGWVHHCLVLLSEEDLCLKDVLIITSFIQELVVYHKEYVFIVDNKDILRKIV